MPSLALANRRQRQAISRESHALWGGGLSRAAYFDYWERLASTAWARDRLEHLVWCDDRGRVLSSMKIYRLDVRLLGRNARAGMIGSVFTPRAARGAGHAREMLRAAAQRQRRRGAELLLLFSDIGAAFYSEVGFKRLPAEEYWGRLVRGALQADRAVDFKEFADTDLPAVMSAHRRWTERHDIAILRDADHWRYIVARATGFFRRFRNPRRAQRFRIAFRHGRFLGYLITTEGEGEWILREVGGRGGDPDAMSEVLEAAAVRAVERGLVKTYGWLEPSVAERLAGWGLSHGPRAGAIPMALDLRGGTDLERISTVDSAFIPYQDQF